MNGLFAAVIAVLCALVWGCIFAAAGMTGWLLLIACSVVFIVVMIAMSLCSVAR